jgi:phosphoglycolate phosphatase
LRKTEQRIVSCGSESNPRAIHRSTIKAILFDLDGTLADTAPDLGRALNAQRELHGRPPLPFEAIRPHASKGARGMLKAGFDLVPEDAQFPAMRDEYLKLYERFVGNEPRLFPGISELLRGLENKQVQWGICTNKPKRFTEVIVAILELTGADAVVCGDQCAHPKPDPEMLLTAAKEIGVAAETCMYVGDDRRDCEAASAAAMPMIIAGWGYIGVDENPRKWGARAIVQSPTELLNYL